MLGKGTLFVGKKLIEKQAECSRLASRVEELEAALEHLVVLVGAKSTFTKTDRQVVELAVRAHGGIRNIFEEEV